jgi:TRAF3-interacting protein 1
MADIEALIPETIEILGPLIAKPKMSDKYLRKPPFRYLHDIVVALVEAHQFPKRLAAQDLDHNNFTEKVGCFSVLLLPFCVPLP